MDLGFWVLDIAILLRVAFEWTGSDIGNPLVRVVYRISEPILVPLRRYIRPLAGLDITPIIAIVILGAVRRLLIAMLF